MLVVSIIYFFVFSVHLINNHHLSERRGTAIYHLRDAPSKYAKKKEQREAQDRELAEAVSKLALQEQEIKKLTEQKYFHDKHMLS